MKKIIIIGAGIGGLSVARTLSESNFDVTVFEQKKRKDIAYDWHDDVAPQVFRRINMPLIDEKCCFPKANWSFVPPESDKPVKLVLPEDKEKDLSVERRPLSEYLMSFSINKVKFLFETPVEKIIIREDKVCGVVANNEQIECDLVIDSSGVDSPFRKSLPDSFMIQKNYKNNEMFYAYRAFYTRTNAPVNEHTNKAYLLHLGERGISWCIDQHTYVDVLIGRLGKISQPVIDNALCKLRIDNNNLSDKVLRGGIMCKIPVRYPLSVMVGNGYAAIGDCAYMTIPMIGSGIASSMLSGYMLGNLLIKDASEKGFSIDTLWQYQLAVFKEFGTKHAGVDAVKRWAITKATPKQVRTAMEKGIINKDDMATASSGEPIVLTFLQILEKIRKGFFHLPTLLSMLPMLNQSNRAMKHCQSIPKSYNTEKIKKWADRLDKIFSK